MDSRRSERSLCTVLLLIPNFFAADRTVAFVSMMYIAKSQARSSMLVFKNITPGNSHARLYAEKADDMRSGQAQNIIFEHFSNTLRARFCD